MTCNCYSYNWCVGETPEVVLNVPDFIFKLTSRDTVCIDACIVDDIRKLWSAKVVTLNSCCGHNKVAPSIVLEDQVEETTVKTVRSLVGTRFQLLSWYGEKRIMV